MTEPQLTFVVIIGRRVLIEARLASVLTQKKGSPTLDDIKALIFHADHYEGFNTYVRYMLDVLDISVDDALPLIEDAWNYFPHHSLGGQCPAELSSRRQIS